MNRQTRNTIFLAITLIMASVMQSAYALPPPTALPYCNAYNYGEVAEQLTYLRRNIIRHDVYMCLGNQGWKLQYSYVTDTNAV
jgi:hypothetical protein